MSNPTQRDFELQEIAAVKDALETAKGKGEVRINFKPRTAQRWIFDVLDKNRYSVVVAHRRLGKTFSLVAYLISRALKNNRGIIDPIHPPKYAFISPTIDQSLKNVWGYLKEMTSTLDGVEYLRSQRLIRLPNKAEIYVTGATNPDFQRGSYLDGVCMDEVAYMPGSHVWESVIYPMLWDYKGFCIFSSTPAGRNFFYRLYKEAQEKEGWGTISLPVTQTQISPMEEWEEFFSSQSIPESKKMREYFCSFEEPLEGAYYGSVIRDLYERNRVGDFPYNPSLPVFTGWDIGISESDTTSIWFCQKNPETKRWQMIDYEAGVGLPATDWARIVRAKEYNYAMHILPFDAFNRDSGSGFSYDYFLHQSGLRDIQRAGDKPKDTTVKLEQIEQARRLLGNFDFNLSGMVSGKDCPLGIRAGKPRDKENGLDALSLYRSEYDEAKQNFSRKPLHNWCSHAADAFRYLSMILGPITETGKSIDRLIRKGDSGEMEHKNPFLDKDFFMGDEAVGVARMDIGGVMG